MIREKHIAFYLLSAILAVAFLALTGAQDAHLVCGQVNNAADGTDSGWREVRIYPASNPAAYAWGQVSPQTDRYCVSAIGIPGYSWVAGDTLAVEVSLQADNYYAGPVSVTTTAQGRDIAPEMALMHLVDISSPLNQTYNSTTVSLNIHTRTELSNSISYSLDAGADTILCSACNDASTSLTLADGSHFITVLASDAALNVLSHTVYFSIDTTPDKKVKKEKKEKHPKVKKDKALDFRVSDGDEGGINEIIIFPNKDKDDVEIKFKEFTERPSGVKRVSGKVYKYHEIDVGGLSDDDIEASTIKFRVEQSWLQENKLDASTLVLSRFNEETRRWEDLETALVNENKEFAFYESQSPGFSIFVIRVPARGGYTEIRTQFFAFMLLTILIALYVVYSILLRKRALSAYVKAVKSKQKVKA